MAGVVGAPYFDQLVRQAFMYIIMLKLKDNFTKRMTERPQLYRVYRSELQDRDRATARALLDQKWLDHLDFDYSDIEFRPVPKDVSSAQLNFHNQV